jgi:hypothetical protein
MAFAHNQSNHLGQMQRAAIGGLRNLFAAAEPVRNE